MSKLGFEPQISGFTHRFLNQLNHRDTYTSSETNLSIFHIASGTNACSETDVIEKELSLADRNRCSAHEQFILLSITQAVF